VANNTPSPFTNQRLFDLVRQQRMELRAADLISDEEYLELAKEHAAVARLEDYGDLRERIRTLEAERTEDRKRLDWLQKQDSGTLKIAIYQNGHAEVNPNGKIANWYVSNSLREALDAARKGATE